MTTPQYWHVFAEDCVIAEGPRTSSGRVRVKVNGKWQIANRVAYEQAFGPIPQGRYVMTKCRNQLCINPRHLYIKDETTDQ